MISEVLPAWQRSSKLSVLFILTFGFLMRCAGPPVAENISLVANSNANAPLAGILSFTSDRPVVPTLMIDDGKNQQIVTPDTDPKTNHQVLVLGLRPDRTHQVAVTIRDEKGRESTLDTLEIRTPPLPEDFPPLKVIQEESNIMEPGITMFCVFRWQGQFEDDPDWGYIIGVDDKGEVVWYLKSDRFLGEARRMFNGNLAVSIGIDGRMQELDMLGNTVREWHPKGSPLGELAKNSIAVETDGFHHDVIELSSGNFIGLGLEAVEIEDFPAEYPPGTKRETALVAGDVLIEFAPDGHTVRKWSVVDILDPTRLGQGSLDQVFYEKLYDKKYDKLPYDITHCNALYYLKEDDALLVSSYRQNIVYKVDMASGELEWMFGDTIGWKQPWSEKLLKPKGAITWPSHQHGLETTPRGTILMFDNGSGRNIPPQKALAPEEQYSRVVEFRVDQAAGTVEEVWVYGPEQEHFSSPFICDADYLPQTGNILITDGGRFRDEDGKPVNTFGGHQWARIFEVTYEDKKKIWELEIYDPETRYSVYRAQRFRSLYPQLDRKTG